MARRTEFELVENYITKSLEERGWKFVPADELERQSFEEPLVVPSFVRALERINEEAGIGDAEVKKALNELKLTSTGTGGAKRILRFYKLGIPIKFEKERVVKYVRLFDTEDIENNEFIVTRQAHYQGRERIRTDIILYVNGIPLVNIECKSPLSLTENWYSAYEQIKDYEKTVPELYKYVQIGAAAESIARYFAIVPWQEDVTTHEWREEGKDSIDSFVEMLSPATLLDIIQNFLFFRVEFGNASKVITRYMQYRAANKIVGRVLANLQGREQKDRGLIWHWQGSGKTLTMIFAANKLHYMKELENPTLFFIVDRIELEEQLYKEFNAMDIVSSEIIGSIGKLKEVIAHDDYRGKRGVFITLIHKFRPDELKGLCEEIEEVSRTKETIKDRKNVVAFIDEGHRTQYGTLAAQMKEILKNAFFYALTGTPIAKKGKDTYREFSYPPEEPYLDRYFITDSIRDGFTVKIAYQPRLEKEVHLKKDLLEAFLEMEFEELDEEIREGVEERVKKRVNAIKIVLENPARIEAIAEDIAGHFKENVDGKFKAMIVTGSRKACVLYKKELDEHLPPEYSEVVMTYTRDDEQLIKKFAESTRARFAGKDIEDIRKELVERFKEEDLPKIFIVTDMLLTGFDAPALQTMYLDKPLKEHRLLQAVARTNRPFKDVKEAGLIIDYIGVLSEIKKSLEMYSEEDIKGALFNYRGIREELVTLITELLGILGDMPKVYERETLLKAVEVLTSDAEKEKDFVAKYRNLRKTFELLGPDEIKLEHFEDYKWLSSIYTYYMRIVLRKPAYDEYIQKYYDKTVKFIHRSTDIEKIEKELPVINFDRDYLKLLEERVKSKKEKAANILFTLNRMVLVERHKNPVYESLVEKVDRLLELWKEKTKDFGKIYEEGAKIVSKITALTDRQKVLNFSDLEYSILLTLEDAVGKKDDIPKEVKDFAEDLEKLFFPGFLSQTTAKKEVEREIRRFVRGLKRKYDISLEEMNKLHKKIVESVKNYGSKYIL